MIITGRATSSAVEGLLLRPPHEKRATSGRSKNANLIIGYIFIFNKGTKSSASINYKIAKKRSFAQCSCHLRPKRTGQIATEAEYFVKNMHFGLSSYRAGLVDIRSAEQDFRSKISQKQIKFFAKSLHI